MKPGVRSLAGIVPDQPVVVRRILFECLRERCGDLGLREGDHLRFGRWEGGALLVRKRDGRVVSCPVALARFVEVEGVGT